MKGSLGYLKAAVVGFAVFAGGKALYENRDRLKREWDRVRDLQGIKDMAGDLSISKVLGSVGSLKNLAHQLSQLKQS